jgi:hypothetical protein
MHDSTRTRLSCSMVIVVAVVTVLANACGRENEPAGNTGGSTPMAGFGGQQYVAGYGYGGMGGTGGAVQPVAGASGIPGTGGMETGGTSGMVAGGTGGVAGMAGMAGTVTGGTGGDAGTAGTAGTVTGGTGGDAGAAGVTAGTGGAAGTSGLGCEGNQTLPPVTDIGQSGPFATTTETNTGPTGTETIFRPDPLGTDGFLHPMVTFGPGIWTSGGTSYTTLLTHLATLGFVVIAVEALNGGPGDSANTAAMVDALDWLIAQNSQAGVYQNMLAVNCGVAMGYSLGASATPFVGEHPAVVTGVAIHGHMQMQSALPHGPVLFLTGNGPSAVGDQVAQVVAGLTTAPGLMALYEGQGHMTVMSQQLQTGQPEFVALTAWLRYWVNGDDSAKNHFWGPGCTMCSDPSWTMQGNALWDALSL